MPYPTQQDSPQYTYRLTTSKSPDLNPTEHMGDEFDRHAATPATTTDSSTQTLQAVCMIRNLPGVEND